MIDGNNLVLSVLEPNDLDILKDNNDILYVNIDIKNPNREIINYFLNNGEKYSFTEDILGINGYIYVDYDCFCNGQKKIDELIEKMPDNLNSLEKAKYLYIALGKMLKYDINAVYEKNEVFYYGNVDRINNLWGCINFERGTNLSLSKVYLYLCSLVGIDCEIITINELGFKANKITVMNGDKKNVLIVNLTEDLPYIQGGFKTRFFGSYNDETELDKKIGYVASSDRIIDSIMKKINYDSDDVLAIVLSKTEVVFDINMMGQIELGIIYDNILREYCPSNHFVINNLYVNDIYGNKEHFILINDNSKHYIFNYRTRHFCEMFKDDLIRNIEQNRIGIYMGEIIPNLELNYHRGV